MTAQTAASAYRGMAHLPVLDAPGQQCWRCANFLPASDPAKGRCVKFVEFVGKSHQLDDRHNLDNADWWRGLPTISRLAVACKYFTDAAQEVLYVLAEPNEMKPNYSQARWLQRIAASPLMLTKSPDEETLYSLQDGTPVPPATAKLLIKNGWLKPQRDGLFDEPQTYRALKPAQ